MAIRFGSALDSIQRRGIANGGPINQGGLQAQIKAKATRSEPSAKAVELPRKALYRSGSVQRVLDAVPSVTTADTLADANEQDEATTVTKAIVKTLQDRTEAVKREIAATESVTDKRKKVATVGSDTLHTQPKRSKPIADKSASRRNEKMPIADNIAENLSADARYKKNHADEIRERDRLRKAAKYVAKKSKPPGSQ